MDPNETLAIIRELVKQIESYPDMGSAAFVSEQTELGLDLAEHVAALDQWISLGGFLPQKWGGR